MFNRFGTFAVVALASASLPLSAQRVYSAQDYAAAERWMGYNLHGLVEHAVSGVQYLPDGRVFYHDAGSKDTLYMVADPAKGTTAPAFENARLAAALSAASGRTVEGSKLGVSEFEPMADGGFTVTTRVGKFTCDAAVTKCAAEAPPPAPIETAVKPGETKPAAVAVPARRRGHGAENVSPDKKLAAFIRDNNLWVKVVATGEEKQLTSDGVQDFGYATDNAGWQHTDAAILTWSDDSKKIATFQQDQRKTGEMYLVPVVSGHPKLEAWKYPLVGDKDVTMIEPVILDVASGQMVRLKTAPLEHRSMECDDISCDGDGKWSDVNFSPDDSQLAFVATSRDHKDEWVRVADTASGEVREVYHESVPTYYGWQSKTDWKVLWGSDEFLWVSERSNWAQIYLYDLKTGELKKEVTKGDGPVQDIVSVDEKARVLYFLAKGKVKGMHPYFDQYYRVGFDGKHMERLTPEDANHVVTAAGDGGSFVDVYSTIDQPDTAVLRDNTGKLIATLGKEDISALLATGWKAPEPIAVKARDGKTLVYGMMWKPMNFDATKKYPVIDYVYPGPQEGSCQSFNFTTSHGDMEALAQLGFVMVCIDGEGNPGRSKSFHDAHASKPEDMGDDTIPDQVSGIEDLASRNPWMDLDRVGIWGHSGGGNATVSAMFHAPEFFKVGWAESGNHDQRVYEDDWDERWAGLETFDENGRSNYETQANQNYAANLKGHLMLVHGTMDDNVPPNNTLLVDEALMKANKSFDMLMVPNVHHGYAAMGPYIMRRRWDYFVTNLAGGVPPVNYQMTSYEQMIRLLYGPSADVEP